MNFLRNFHTVFQSGFTNLHSYQQCMSVPFSIQPLQHFCVFSIIVIPTILDDANHCGSGLYFLKN